MASSIFMIHCDIMKWQAIQENSCIKIGWSGMLVYIFCGSCFWNSGVKTTYSWLSCSTLIIRNCLKSDLLKVQSYEFAFTFFKSTATQQKLRDEELPSNKEVNEVF